MIRPPMPELPKNAPPDMVERYRRMEATMDREVKQALMLAWAAGIVLLAVLAVVGGFAIAPLFL